MLRPGAAAGAEEVTALPWIGAKAAALVALRRALDLAELLAVHGPYAPAALGAGVVTGGTWN